MVPKAVQILEFIRQFPSRDDDEIARALKISPRQSVNMTCRKLESQGKIRRVKGVAGKIVNIGATHPNEAARPVSGPAIVESDHDGEAVVQQRRPFLEVGRLLEGGFNYSADWILSPQGALQTSAPLPRVKGVYVFVRAGIATYVGVATMGLAKRLYFYRRPGRTQRTSQRLNGILLAELNKRELISIYTASPANMNWNGLPVSRIVGLEMGLIESFHLPWNIRGAR